MWRAILAMSLVARCASRRRSRAQDSLEKLATDFWTWRAETAPFNDDDVPRMERPAGLKRSWSAAAIAKQHADLAAFEARYKKIDATKWQVPQQVDYRLIGSALARVRWELDYNKRYQTDADVLRRSGDGADRGSDPADAAVRQSAQRRFDRPRAKCAGRSSTTPKPICKSRARRSPSSPIESLTDIRTQLWEMAHEVTPQLKGDNLQELSPARRARRGLARKLSRVAQAARRDDAAVLAGRPRSIHVFP